MRGRGNGIIGVNGDLWRDRCILMGVALFVVMSLGVSPVLFKTRSATTISIRGVLFLI